MSSYTRCGCVAGSLNYNGDLVPPNPNNCLTNCLYAPDLAVLCADSDFPGANITVDISTQHNGALFCSTGVTYTLYNYDTAVFSAAAIVGNEFQATIDASTTAKTGTATIIVQCDGEIYAAKFKLHVCVKSRCTNVYCAQGEVCDPATGNCIPLTDIEVS